MIISLLLLALDHRYQQTEQLRAVLATAVYPLQTLATFPTGVRNWFEHNWAERRRLQRQLAKLHQENLLLSARLQQFDALQAENIRLRDLVGSSFKLGDQVLIAEIMAIDLSPYRQHLMINRGSRSGVFVGQPVLHTNAVMGQVTHVTPFTATVILITDSHHALPVLVNRNGLRTIAVGTGEIDRLELPHLPHNADIQPDDLLVTSGIGGSFPPGYPVAVVTDVRREPGQSFATVVAVPQAHLANIREVLLIWTLEQASANQPEEAEQQETEPTTDPS